MSRFGFPLLLIGAGALSAVIALQGVDDAPRTATYAASAPAAPASALVTESLGSVGAAMSAPVTVAAAPAPAYPVEGPITVTEEVPVTATEAPVTVTQEVVATEYIERPGPTVTEYATMPVAVTEVQTVTKTVEVAPASAPQVREVAPSVREAQPSAPESPKTLTFEDGSSLPADQVGKATSVADANNRACMVAADRIVSYGWSGSAEEVQCFGSEDNLAAINDAYGALEAESGQGSYTNPHPGYATCATEDAPGPCFWSASEQGNGQGHSFLREANGSITYLG